MKFVWTRRKKWDIVAWGLGEDCSHFGILWSNNYVSHWSVGGYKYEHVSLFQQKREIKHSMPFPLDLEHESRVIKKINERERPNYDWSYVIGLASYVLGRVLFGIEIPREGSNIVDNQDSNICHEAVESYNLYMKDINPEKIVVVNYERANTPHRLYEELLKEKK